MGNCHPFGRKSRRRDSEYLDEDDLPDVPPEREQRVVEHRVVHVVRSASASSRASLDSALSLPSHVNPRDYVPDYMSEEEAVLKAKRLTMIQLLPTIKYAAKSVPKRQRECLICCDDYIEGDLLHALPCFHVYHKDCVEDWLSRSFVCPICMREIDVESIEAMSWPPLDTAKAPSAGGPSSAEGKGKEPMSHDALPAQPLAVTHGIPLESL
eukprot:Opistho-1_new@89923